MYIKILVKVNLRILHAMMSIFEQIYSFYLLLVQLVLRLHYKLLFNKMDCRSENAKCIFLILGPYAKTWRKFD